MKQSIYILLLLFSITNSLFSKNETELFPVRHGNKWGYIDQKAKLKIDYKFNVASDFFEGLASVRANNLYGYIDTKGNFKIKEKFDYAEDFYFGLARVYFDGKAYIINKKGDFLFEHNFKNIEYFLDHNYAKVQTNSKKYGLVNRKGQLILDTLYDYIDEFSRGYAVTKTIYFDSSSKEHALYSIVDTNGRTIIDDKKYSKISINNIDIFNLILENFNPNYQSFGIQDDNILNSIFSPMGKSLRTIKNRYDCNLTDYFKNKIDSMNIDQCIYWNTHIGPQKKITSKIAYAFVEIKGKWFAIDSNGNNLFNNFFIEKSKYISNRFDNWLLFYQEQKYGIWNAETNQIYDLGVDEIYLSTLYKPLLRVVINNQIQYLDKNFQPVWSEDTTVKKSKIMNIDYKIEPKFYQFNYLTAPYRDKRTFDQYIQDSSLSKDSQYYLQKLIDSNAFQLVLNNSKVLVCQNNYLCNPLYLFNSSDNKVIFRTLERCLRMYIQVKDRKGNWQDINYMLSSFCGNTPHPNLYLNSNQFWEIKVPIFEGPYKTKLRIKLHYIRDLKSNEKFIIYSNEIDASINPGQMINHNTPRLDNIFNFSFPYFTGEDYVDE